MRSRSALLATLVVLAACSQDDQPLPFETDPGKPVTVTTGSGATTVSTPDGISMTVPAGAVPEGTKITVAKVSAAKLSGLRYAVGDAYIMGFSAAPAKDPAVTFSAAVNQQLTAGQLLGMVPVVMRLQAPGASGAARAPASSTVAPLAVGPGISRTSEADVETRMRELMEAGIFDGFEGSASIQDQLLAGRDQMVQLLNHMLGGLREDELHLSPPLFDDVASSPESWFAQYVSAAGQSALLSGFGADGEFTTSWQTLATIPDPSFLLQSVVADALGSDYSSGMYVYVAGLMRSASTMAFEGVEFTPPASSGTPALIPLGHTSATFALACTGIQWPGADGVPSCSENTIDVRTDAEVLSRFPGTAIVPNYLLAQFTLDAVGTASGQVDYDVYLRSPLAASIAGVGTKDSLNLSGPWSTRGDTITIAGHDFLYALPDSATMILSFSDSVQLANGDGGRTWHPIRASLKLTRQ